MRAAAARLDDRCMCGRLHPCQLHNLKAIHARNSGLPQETQLSLFVQEAKKR